ncbi:MAG: hypothetical protein JRE71_19345 [Deltaproteobacteria bacterium]|nr:hypothetical protein [Deltaproteobacteria bacterium]
MANPSQETRKVRLTLSPEAEKYARRDAPVSVRRMAAGGALPLEPVELASVLFALLHDPDEEVKQRAGKSLEELPPTVLDTVLSGPTHPAILSFYSKLKFQDGHACELIALNAASSDTTIAFLATLPHKRIVDIVSQNQERLMRCEEILEALGENPLTGRAAIAKILSFLGITDEEGNAQKNEALDAHDDLSDEDAEAAVAALLGEEYAHLARHLSSENDDELDEEITEGRDPEDGRDAEDQTRPQRRQGGPWSTAPGPQQGRLHLGDHEPENHGQRNRRDREQPKFPRGGSPHHLDESGVHQALRGQARALEKLEDSPVPGDEISELSARQGSQGPDEE